MSPESLKAYHAANPSAEQEIADLRTRLQTAEQQLGQVTKELESVQQDLYETNESYEKAAHDRDVGVKDCRRLVTELGQVREEVKELRNFIPNLAKELRIMAKAESLVRIRSMLEAAAARVDALSATPSDGCGKGRTDKERLDQWSDDDKKELARIEAQSKEEAFAEMSANSVDVAAFTERVNQIVDAGVTKHSIYCEITRSDGSVHMLPDPVKVGDVEWQLRYGKPESVRWQAASVIGFYRTFFSLPYKSRLEVMSKILAASSKGKDGGE